VLKVPAVERWKTLNYCTLKYRWLKENGIETGQVVGRVAASKFASANLFTLIL
jgi:hypothetical protein